MRESVSGQTVPSTEVDTSGVRVVDSNIVFSAPQSFEMYLDLLHLLYTSLASLLGIETLRRRLNSWLITEQMLLKVYGWKWKGRSGSKPTVDNILCEKQRPEFMSTSLLLSEIGWSLPQSKPSRKVSDMGDSSMQLSISFEKGESNDCGPWMWLPISNDYWDNTEYLSRGGLLANAVNERVWKAKLCVSHAWRAHLGPLKAIAVGDGETTIFTAGVGTKMSGLVKQWQLSSTQSNMTYAGHEEVVNDICIVPRTHRVASCDGSIHLWDSRTGKCIVTFSESKTVGRTPSQGFIENNSTPSFSTTPTGTTGEILLTGLHGHGNQYTCIHLMQQEQRLIAGTGSGQLRFFDLASGQALHLWRCDYRSHVSPLVSAISYVGTQSFMDGGGALSFPWIAVSFGNGLCRLMDSRVGNFVASWTAHKGYITKLAAFKDHYLVSSSLDKTLCLWDLRRIGPIKVQTFHGHSNGVASFEVWGNNLLSAGGNKIAISTVSSPGAEAQASQTLRCNKLFSSDLSTMGLSSITATSILPFSRFFLIGTDDGYLRVCN